ncbi:hypothetical protein AB0D08_39000 [Kitasatospora sp. NPDC048540]|uniref:hypothetical protein n=1 Tax=unclassified Kitasatospora TaxID=2633591 RepID=UPI00068E363B|nr:hypothetical protein [Kitasatospora sp. MBT63]
MTASASFLDRYVRVWNEPDPAARRAAVAELWTPDGLHYTQTRVFRGTDALDARTTEAYDQFVGGSGLLFRHRDNLVAHHDAAVFNWEMTPGSSHDVLAVGFDFVLLDEAGRIRVDYQFNEPPAPVAELDELAGRLLALAKEPDEELRGKQTAALYSPHARLVDAAAERDVPSALAAAPAGEVRRLRGHASAQHDAVRYGWELTPADGGPAVTGVDFLIRGEDGLFTAHYRFTI